MRILLTNDDGIHAGGLAALERIAVTLSDDVWICAPETEQSGASRALTLTEPLRVRRLGPRRFAVRGTPTDCVMLAMQELISGAKPDLVLSGVNRGANLAEDVSLSGTVAAAIEAMTLGVPAIALSQMHGPYKVDEPDAFDVAETHAPAVVRALLGAGWPSGVVLNVNFPVSDAKAMPFEVTRQGFRDARTRFAELRTDLRGRQYYWVGYDARPSKPAAGTDLAAAYAGRISVTPLHIDMTHVATLQSLRESLAAVEAAA
jgi:5'-nucleotidase